MNDPFGLEASQLPPELIAQLSGARSQRAIAEAILKQSMTPLQVDQPKGRFQGVVSPLEAIAKVAQNFQGRGGIEASDKVSEAIAQKQQEGRKQAMADYERMKMGVPGTAPLTPNDDEGNPMPMVGAVKGDPMKAITQGLMNPYMPKDFLRFEADRAFRNEDREDKQVQQKQTQAAQLEQRKWETEQKHKDRMAQIEALRITEIEKEKMRAEERANYARLVAALRPDKPEPAPAQGQVVDPKDQNRMLLVNTREYKGGTLGEAGVIGVAGKEPAAAKKEEKVDAGRETVSTLVSQLKSYYDDLNQSGAITNPERSGMSNVASGTANTGFGQAVGRVFGTESQSKRDSIAQQRPLLLNAIKEATGMSAKQMDSNAELKLYLSAATDPAMGYPANIRALEMLDKLYGLSGKPKKAGGRIKFDANGNEIP